MGDSITRTVAQIGFTLGGAYFGGPIGAFAGLVLANYLFPPPTVKIYGPRLSDLKVNLSRYGTPIFIVYGHSICGGTAYWATDIVEKIHQQTDSGKGGQKTVTRTYYYSANVAFKFASSPENFPIVSMPQLYADGKLVMDFTNQTGPIFSAPFIGETGGPFNTGTIRLRFGEEDQLPDPLIESFIGVGMTEADRGDGTMVLDDFPITDWGNRLPLFTMVITTSNTPVYPKIQMNNWTQNTGNLKLIQGTFLAVIDGDNDTPLFVNALTQEFVISGPELEDFPGDGSQGVSDGNETEGYWDVDEFGHGLSYDLTLGVVVTPFVHNVFEFTVRARAIHGVTGLVGTTDARFFGRNHRRMIFMGNNGQTIWVGGGASEWRAVTTSDGASWSGMDIIPTYHGPTAYVGDLGMPSQGPEWAVTDKADDYTLWMAFADGADDLFVEFSGDSGLPINQYTVTGRHADVLGYDGATHSLIFLDDDVFYRWDIATQTLDPTSIDLGNTNGTRSAFQNNTYQGQIYIGVGVFGPDVARIDVPTMTLVKQYDMDGNFGEGNVQGPVYIPVLHAVVMSNNLNNPVNWLFLDRDSLAGVTLKSILDNETSRVNLLPDVDSDASDHSAVIVPGFNVGRRAPTTEATDTLSDVYKFGQVEEDHQVKYLARGAATTFNIPEDDLGVFEGSGQDVEKLIITDRDRETIPRDVESTVIDPDFEYQDNMAIARRNTNVIMSERIHNREVALTLTALENRQRALIDLKDKWANSRVYEFTTFPKHIAIGPASTGIVNADGRAHLVTLIEVNQGVNGIIECQGIGFPLADVAAADATLAVLQALDSTLQGGDADTTTTNPLATPEQILFDVVDSILLRDVDSPGLSAMGAYVFAARASENFSGANVLDSGDNISFANHVFFPKAQESDIGLTETKLADTSDYLTIDDVNSVDVNFPESVTLVSVSDADLFQGKNAFLMGGEILQVGTVVDNLNGSWTLSHLLRGRRGSDYYTDKHATLERVYFLGDVIDAGKTVFAIDALAHINALRYFQAFAINGTIDFPSTKMFTNSGKSNWPLAPVAFAGVKSGGDWSCSFWRRGRLDAEMRDGADVPLSQTESLWEIDIWDEDGTVVRTIKSVASANGSVVTENAFTYDQLDQEADFSESPIVSSYPLYRFEGEGFQTDSGVAGRGFGRQFAIEDFPDPVADDANFANTALILQANSLDVRDKSAKRKFINPITVGSALTLETGDFSIRRSQYGGAVINFDNVANSELRIPRGNIAQIFDIGSGDFTFEAWVHQSQEHDGELLCIWGTEGNQEWIWSFRTTGGGNRGGLRFDWTTDGSGDQGHQQNFADDISLGLMHIATTKSGTVLRHYRDGAQVGANGSVIGTIFSGGNADLVIGVQNNGSSNHFVGKLDSMRVTMGTALYTGATYDVPTTRFANN